MFQQQDYIKPKTKKNRSNRLIAFMIGITLLFLLGAGLFFRSGFFSFIKGTSQPPSQGTIPLIAKTIYLPFIVNKATDHSVAAIYIENTSATTTDVVIDYYHINGEKVYTNNFKIAPFAIATLDNNDPTFPHEFSGTAIVNSSELISVVTTTAINPDKEAFNGLVKGEKSLYLAVWNNQTTDGWTTNTQIWNINPIPAAVVLHCYNSAGQPVDQWQTTIAPYASWQPFLRGDLPLQFSGAALVTADQPITAILIDTNTNGNRLIHIGQAPSVSTLYLPIITTKQEGWAGNLHLFNGSDESRRLSLLYFADNGRVVSNPLEIVLAPHESHTLSPSDNRLPQQYGGAARLTTDGPFAGFVDEHGGANGTSTMTYFAESVTAKTIYCPIFWRKKDGWSSTIHIYAPKDGAEINAPKKENFFVIFYNPDGKEQARLPLTLTANGYMHLAATDLQFLPSTFTGSLVIHSDIPLIAVVDTNSIDGAFSYDASIGLEATTPN